MKAFITIALLLCGSFGLQAQDLSLNVIGNAGGHSAQSSAQLTWTLGELSIATFDQPQATLTQGFNQTNLVVTAVENAFPQAWDIKAFPNPVTDVLHVKWEENAAPVQLRFINQSGQVLFQSKVENASETDLQVRNYAQGTYFLEVFDEQGVKGKTFKVEVIRH